MLLLLLSLSPVAIVCLFIKVIFLPETMGRADIRLRYCESWQTGTVADTVAEAETGSVHKACESSVDRDRKSL